MSFKPASRKHAVQPTSRPASHALHGIHLTMPSRQCSMRAQTSWSLGCPASYQHTQTHSSTDFMACRRRGTPDALNMQHPAPCCIRVRSATKMSCLIPAYTNAFLLHAASGCVWRPRGSSGGGHWGQRRRRRVCSSAGAPAQWPALKTSSQGACIQNAGSKNAEAGRATQWWGTLIPWRRRVRVWTTPGVVMRCQLPVESRHTPAPPMPEQLGRCTARWSMVGAYNGDTGVAPSAA